MHDKRKLAIEVDNVQKIYKLYDKPSDRLKEAFGFGKKTKHKLHYALKGVSMKTVSYTHLLPISPTAPTITVLSSSPRS